tara:strand:+ start:842 stop:1165 length:324 start_codon:yes stop_codon:yes gene_type:complete
MKKITDSLGKEGDFQVGDLVGWTDLSKKRQDMPRNFDSDLPNIDYKRVGIVSEVFSEQIGGRKVVLARVFCLKDEKKYEIPLITLKRIDKNKTIYKREGKNDGICYN